MFIENEDSFKKSLSEGINLFLGAGFSIFAKDHSGKNLPLGKQLKDELLDEFNLKELSSLDLSEISTILEETRKDNLYNFIKRRFSVEEFDDRYLFLQKVKIEYIFTTNVDNLLHKVFSLSKTHYLNDLDFEGPSFSDKSAIDVIYLHGCIIHPEREITLSSRDIAAAFSSEPNRWYLFISQLQKRPTLFWGSALLDSGTLEALNPRKVRGKKFKEMWIVVSPDSLNSAYERFLKAMNFQIIESDTQEILDFLQSLKIDSMLGQYELSRKTEYLFPQESIPKIGSVPVRPITDFYQGAPPSWHDIFSNKLHKTLHYMKIKNSIDSRKNTIAIGMPACGKTTLLMQVASDISFSGHKLVVDSITPNKAQLIINKLEGERALIFIDNFTDSINSFNMLSRTNNIQIVGFDRDYNFDIVSHKIETGKFNILDLTELSELDIQSIVNNIPANIKSPDFKNPILSEGQDYSLFEIIDCNIVYPFIRNRFRSMLEQLERDNPNLLDLLLVCSYVHSCRTPISMDMLLTYFHERINGYNEIYEMIDMLSSLIVDYVGDLDDEEQDYFVPRSVIVSESIIQQSHVEPLKSMLIRFHKNIPKYSIHRYDIFRMRAFDANLAKKAFLNWEEGKQFYEYVYDINPSPYLLQQGALYLAHKNRFTDAFNWIDDAINQTQRKVFSIRNSHAIILFKANIRREETDGTVKRTLQESMEILHECYTNDKRKAYHAMTFADHALQYWDAYGDTTAKGYLNTAKQWLDEVIRSSPQRRNISRLLREVIKKIKASELT